MTEATTVPAMKFIRIEGRMSQNGSVAPQAVIIFPGWMSPTLVCAGITGRVIELTDGSVIEEGTLPNECTEADFLAAIKKANEPSDPEPTPEIEPAPEGVEVYDVKEYWDKLNGILTEFGCPPETSRLGWIREQLEKLDAWRDAANNCTNLVQKFNPLTGFIEELSFAAVPRNQRGEVLHETLQRELREARDELAALTAQTDGIAQLKELHIPIGEPTVVNFNGPVTIHVGKV